MFVEAFFLADIIFRFLQEYISEDDYFPVRDIKMLAIRYIKGSFFFDFLAFIPFNMLIVDKEAKQLSQLFKLLRLPRMFNLLKVRTFKTIIDSYYQKRLERVINNV